MLQRRAVLPRAAMIAGKDNRSYVKDFSGGDIADLGRVIVDMTNPLSQTVSGRVEMAKDLLSIQGTNPEMYYQVITTGRIEPLLDDKKYEDLGIASEDEALREGRPAEVMVTDMHLRHINAHKRILAGAERFDPALVKRVTDHIQAHINALRTTDPALLNALGQAPIAVMPNGAPTPPQGANAPQPAAQPQPGEPPPPGAPVPPPAGASPEVAGNMPAMPQLPPNAPAA
jgi:hypothetical protein